VALPAVVALVEAPPAPVTDEVGPALAPVVDAAALAPVVELPIPPKGPCVVTPPVVPEVVVGPPAVDAVFTVALCVVGAVVFDKPVVDPPVVLSPSTSLVDWAEHAPVSAPTEVRVRAVARVRRIGGNDWDMAFRPKALQSHPPNATNIWKRFQFDSALQSAGKIAR